MLSIQHILCGVASKDRIDREYIGACIYPDAIRAYTGRREYSHFEAASEGNSIAGFAFPDDMKADRETVQKQLNETGHMDIDHIRTAAIGEETVMDAYEYENKHLKPEMFYAIRDHLCEDRLFDSFIRNEIDCSGKYEDQYIFDGQELNGKDARALIGKIEQYGIYILAEKIYDTKGITTDESWLKETVKPALDEVYNPELSDKTFSFMKLDPQIQEWITNHDFSHTEEGPIPKSHYEQLFAEVETEIGKNADACRIASGKEFESAVTDLSELSKMNNMVVTQ